MTPKPPHLAHQPVVLLILDGWGIRDNGPYAKEGNAIALAHPSRYDALMARYPHAAIDASGKAVGLPDGQMGNSEVGHAIIGSGRILYQDYVRINNAIEDGSFFTNPVLMDAVNHVQQTGGTLHLMGLVSDGGVHSDLGHLLSLLDLAHDHGVKAVRVHAFLDGRDVSPRSAEKYLRTVEENLLAMDYPQIATIAGRYFAMDRDNRWERVQKAYENLVAPTGEIYSPLSLDALQSSYENHGKTDEFVEPAVTDITYGGMNDGDAIIFFNFRPDRAREITRALTQKDFDGFERSKVLNNLYFACMTTYDETFGLPVAFPKVRVTKILGELISEAGLKQFRTAETEKYAHVTFFFNNGREEPFPGEDRKLVASPKVATYDLQPSMSLPAVRDALVDAIGSGQYEFLVANFANPDMVGHTGVLNAAVEAVQAIDEAIGETADAVLKAGGVLLLTADHGNIETMIDADGGPHTAHTTNLVPLLMVSNDASLGLDDSTVHGLSNIAPTILALLGLPKPPEMTAESILTKAGIGV